MTDKKSYDAKIESLSRYIFASPKWHTSLGIILLLGVLIDGAVVRLGSELTFFGTYGFIMPGVLALVLTKPAITLIGKQMTWNRSALLAASCTIFSVIITLFGLIISVDLLPLFFGISLGFIFGIRLLVLAAIADYRIHYITIPALIQSFAGVLFGSIIFPPPYLSLTPVLIALFGSGFMILIWLIDRPMYRAFDVRALSFLNAFIAHMTDGSKHMEDFFREIGEEVYVRQVSIFFRRENSQELIFTIPNVHPGPMGEIGGGNLPAILGSRFDEMVMVSHGCATHDFNLVSENEIEKIVDAINATRKDLTFTDQASLSARIQHGSVSLLYQRFGDSLLMVATRSPEMTEDLDYTIGNAIMCEGHRVSPNIGFVDAHNCMIDEIKSVLPATKIANEYHLAGVKAIDAWEKTETYNFKVGSSHIPVPFGREQGFGDTGIQVMVVEVLDQKTAYVLIDGNNIAQGARETVRNYLLNGYVDEAEIMTTDTHVVNTISGKNPVGMHVPAEEFLPYVVDGVEKAVNGLAPAKAAGSTAECNNIVVFGSSSIAQLASTVNTILIYVVPISFAILLLAFLLSIMAYGIMG